MTSPNLTVASLMSLPEGAEVITQESRFEAGQIWYKVKYERREGWVIGPQIREIKQPVKVIQRKSVNFTGLSDREKDKIRLFEKYDKEAAHRAIKAALGEKTRYLNRPIRRNGVPKY